MKGGHVHENLGSGLLSEKLKARLVQYDAVFHLFRGTAFADPFLLSKSCF